MRWTRHETILEVGHCLHNQLEGPIADSQLGKQEAFSAEAHWKERGLTLATKCYPKEPGTHKAAVIKEELAHSLSELKTDCVDIFYLHAADRSVPFEETLEALNEMHKDGKFVRLGLSNFTAFEVAEIVIMCKERGWVRPTIYQGMYNCISQYYSRSTWYERC